MNPWWLGVAPAQASVTCGGADHRLRWEAGELTALDHEDLEAERTLAALGDERCACVEVLDAWARHDDDARVLVLASRGQMDPLAPPADESTHFGVAQRRVSGGLVISRREPRGTRSPRRRPTVACEAEDELMALLGLGGGLADRLVATVAAGWRERLAARDRRAARVRPQLEAALYGRVCAAVGPWLGESERKVRLTMIDDGAAAGLAAEDDCVRARLAFGWLVDVWVKGLATIWGRFCLEAASEDGERWDLATIGPDLRSPSRITVALSGH